MGISWESSIAGAITKHLFHTPFDIATSWLQMLQGSIVSRPRLYTGGWRINIIGMLGQDRHQMYAQRELEGSHILAGTKKNSLSMQGSRFPSPGSMAPQ